MPLKEYAGKKIELDDDGFVVNVSDWNEDIAKAIAAENSLDQLNEQHWQVINFMRKKFTEDGDTPSVRALGKLSGVTIKELYALFPKGPAKLAAKIAGVPKPRGCI